MATRNDLYNYSGYSLEQVVDTIMQLELDNKNLQDAYDELLDELIEARALIEQLRGEE